IFGARTGERRRFESEEEDGTSGAIAHDRSHPARAGDRRQGRVVDQVGRSGVGQQGDQQRDRREVFPHGREGYVGGEARAPSIWTGIGAGLGYRRARLIRSSSRRSSASFGRPAARFMAIRSSSEANGAFTPPRSSSTRRDQTSAKLAIPMTNGCRSRGRSY